VARHARRKGGRHAKAKPEYQGWGQPAQSSFLDEADQLALAQAGDTPPMGFPAPVLTPAPVQPRYYPAPRQGMTTATRWAITAAVAAFSLVLGAVAILTIAFVMGAPPPADAGQVQRQPQTQTVIVAGDQIKVKARQLCPTEDSCDIDYEGRGTWTITRVVP
jgi:hypothetical protein